MFAQDKQSLERIRSQIVTFIKDYVHSSGHKKAVVGLSGGVDSSLSYFLTCDALGAKNTIGVIMPSRLSNKESRENAEELIKLKKGIKQYYDISSIVEKFGSVLDESEKNKRSRIRIGNIQARTRMIILYDVASREGGLVIGTGNKTELLTGYFTLYGDGGCSIEPLGDLYKTEVWELAQIVGVPKKIISRKPTAELWENQTDETELGIKYRTLDEILWYYIERNNNPDEIVKFGYEREIVEKVVALVKRTKFKRHTPPSPVLRRYNYQELV
ncbi:MAG: NAD+ synthase [Spirochaetota bacterium]|nr:MAG: NAD+ synthase [Spirochaetota bacterium]